MFYQAWFRKNRQGSGKNVQLNMYYLLNLPLIMMYAHSKITASDNFVIYKNYYFQVCFLEKCKMINRLIGSAEEEYVFNFFL